ncbi:hypothetical protein AA0242T_2789 [Acetobacter aceti NRIC 0242]|nr:hypothetical protein AA0242T_2789 [Acetobacter aceti NRIC 0242]
MTHALSEFVWWMMLLSPYSPDLNAIEMTSSVIKVHLYPIGGGLPDISQQIVMGSSGLIRMTSSVVTSFPQA